MRNFGIKRGYKTRTDNAAFDDTGLKDEWQNEVYQRAREIADRRDFRSVLDLGTGSGYKLLKYFGDRETLGVDVASTVAWLKRTYPGRQWSETADGAQGFDLLICADVVEHVLNPDELLEQIKAIAPAAVVLSTPDRGLMVDQDGPPRNLTHVREWTFAEFAKYISSHFEVEEHFISNCAQMTQAIVCRLRREP